ncbi:MAG: DUF166 family protein [Candidatus Hermodarchaeota archaeon]
MDLKSNLKVGLISDGKYGERAFENIKKQFEVKWISVPNLPSNVILDEDLNLSIPECDIYISYVRHPDIIIELAELQKPLILGVLPGVGLLNQVKAINHRVIHAPTMCSLENNTGIPEIDEFTKYYGKPIYKPKLNERGIFEEIKVKRSSLCGSSEAGAEFLLNKEFNIENLQTFALNVCHECRAPRFGLTCDKEVAGINHLISLFNAMSPEDLSQIDEEIKHFIENMRDEYTRRITNSRVLLNEVN